MFCRSLFVLLSFVFWPLCCLSFDFRLLIAHWYLHTFGHCIICPLIFDFWLPIGIFTLLAIVLSVLWFSTSDCPLISSHFWPLCCLSFDFRLLIAHWYLHTFGHCVVCPLIFDFWLPIGIFTLLAIVLSVLWFSTSDCPLISSHFWPLYYLSFDFRLLIANWYLHTFGHCVVCPLIFDFWLPIGIFTLLAIVLSVLWFSTSDCQLVFSHFWPLCCLFFDFWLLIAHWYLQTFLFSVCYFFISSPDPKGQVSYCHHWASVVCRPSSVRPSVNFSHFNQLLWSHRANLNQTLVEWSLEGPLPKLCPVIPTSNQDGRQAKNRKKGGWNFDCSLLL